jgi:hypothetical protein
MESPKPKARKKMIAMFEEDLHEGHVQDDRHLHASVVLEQPLIKQKKLAEIQLAVVDKQIEF